MVQHDMVYALPYFPSLVAPLKMQWETLWKSDLRYASQALTIIINQGREACFPGCKQELTRLLMNLLQTQDMATRTNTMDTFINSIVLTNPDHLALTLWEFFCKLLSRFAWVSCVSWTEETWVSCFLALPGFLASHGRKKPGQVSPLATSC